MNVTKFLIAASSVERQFAVGCQGTALERRMINAGSDAQRSFRMGQDIADPATASRPARALPIQSNA
ncbi:hypothetical protein LU699_10835 [Luteimonas fraxinea]|uniref:Uncharacterized protein n=1 Tax=Luteimonas fraxinea TaxID=2901869 RepID=A0ABS8UHS1_9GAMM|nr:hypothetical protein [Luteimonas fraxinea]MCD9098254.1 hypothetical protein [Luteimonas fraxinea]MCD9126986.1 hypothetical protein [Luteimonas fraxinea]UHH08808.1 hypothetical protein LU699_10835 [Luteimonas fraxinea]